MASENSFPHSATDDTPGVVVSPLHLLLAAIVMGLIARWIWPAVILSGTLVNPGIVTGLVLIGGGLWLSVWADGEFKRADTAVSPYNSATAFVHTGPYRFSRNPMYLSFALIQLGVALAINGLWALIALIPTLLIMNYGIIQREERYLARVFGDEYAAYKTTVRRWI